MDCEQFEVDVTKMTEEELLLMERDARLLFKINHTDPTAPEYGEAIKELMGDGIGEGSIIRSPISLVAAGNLRIGRNVFIGPNFLGMCRGGITIEDNVQIAGNTSILSNNHDLYHREILLCKPVLICEGAWIGANVTILPGIRIGRHAVIGAGSVVTHDVGDYQVAVGNPARAIKELDPERFE